MGLILSRNKPSDKAGTVHKDVGSPLTEGVLQGLVRRAAQRAGFQNNGPHILRHTFCSHLAMRGAATGAIQALAGHADLTTTQRYMHLSPDVIDSALALLDRAGDTAARGDLGEADSPEIANSSR